MTVTKSAVGVPAKQAAEAGYFLVEDIVGQAECFRFSSRLQEYAIGSRKPVGGIRLQREPALEGGGESREGGSDIRKVSGLFNDELFRTLICAEEIVGRMGELVGPGLRLFRADALMKPAAVGSEKGVHQDSPYWSIEPMSLWSCWIPFDDATIDNGCLMVVPGSHRDGPLTHVETQNDYIVPAESYDMDALVHVPMRRGAGLFFHSLLLHGSAANVSGTPRRAVTMSYLAAKHRYTGEGIQPSYPAVG